MVSTSPALISSISRTRLLVMRVFLAVGLLSLIITAGIRWWTATLTPLDYSIYGGLTLLCLLYLGLLLARPTSLRFIEVSGLAINLISQVAAFIFHVSTAPNFLAPATISQFFWLPINYLCIYLIFTPRQAHLLSAGLFAALLFPIIFVRIPDPSRPLSELEQILLLNFFCAQIMIVCLTAAIATIRHHYIQAAQRADYDRLTGLFNRHYLDQLLERIFPMDQAMHPFCIALIDLDYFKRINDEGGHSRGDRALSHIAQVLRNGLRRSDVVGRWGGEEFLVLMPNTSLGDAHAIIQRLAEQLRQSPFEGTILTFSCGLTRALTDDCSETIFARADRALYHAKACGRNCTQIG